MEPRKDKLGFVKTESAREIQTAMSFSKTPKPSRLPSFIGKSWKAKKTWLSDKAEPTKEQHYENISRPNNNHVMVVLYGKSGAGKTQTIKHLIGHNEDVVFPDSLKTSDRSSETRETVEYILTIESKNQEADINHITLGIVDPPGLDDTDGPQQDAWNLESIREFLRGHRELQTAQEGKFRYPNVVLFVINGADKRFIGKDTQLTRGLRNLYSLQLSDWTNLVIVVTNALSIDNSNDTWEKSASKLSTDIQKFVKEEIGRTIPVVLLENSFSKERMRRVSKAWTELPDKKTLQPFNLFTVIQNDILARKHDVIGRIAIREFFARSKSDTKLSIVKGRAVPALRSGISESLNVEISERYESYKRDCVHYRDPWKPPDDDSGVDESVMEPIVEKQLRAGNYDPLPTQSHQELDLDGEDYLIGRGFNIKDGKMLSGQIFRPERVRSGYELITYISTTDTNENKVSEERVETERGGHLMVVGAEGQRQSVNKKVTRIKCRIWRLRVTRFQVRPKQEFCKEWVKQPTLDINFAADLKKLPKKFDVSKMEEYNKFFSAYGVGFVKCAYAGGEATVTSYSNEDDDEAGSKNAIDSVGSITMETIGLPSALCKLGISTNPKSNSLNTSSSYQIKFKGGSQEFQSENKAEEWKKSVADNPSAFFVLDVDSDVELYHNFVSKLGWLNQPVKVARALREAYEEVYIEDVRKEEARKDEKQDGGILDSICSKLKFWS